MKQNIFIIKVGGNVIDDDFKLKSFLAEFALLQGLKILIHGGGKIATTIGKQLNISPNYVDGRRITDGDTLRLVTMVYAGLINKNIVAQLQALSCNALGLTGADANLIPATKRKNTTIDYGWVGDINTIEINIKFIEQTLQQNIVPIIAPITHDTKGSLLNTNADSIASSLAIALSTLYNVRLIYCFDKKGVLETIDDENTVITNLNEPSFEELKKNQQVHEGILPKLESAFIALNSGVKEIIIGDANDLKANCSSNHNGTLIQL